jgi:integrating conjugative element protein (TIGR03759 family)
MIDYRLSLGLLMVILATSAQAVDVEYSNKEHDLSTKTSHIESAETSARRFGITSTDWTTYEEIMKGEGRYHWSHLDPVWVLAIYAQSNAERDRFARLAARQEYERNRKLIQFKDAYVAAFQSMYGHVPIMDLDAMQSRYQERMLDASISSHDQSLRNIKQPTDIKGDRMVLFMATNGCPSCDAVFMQLSRQQTPGVALDVHFIGDTQSNISTWAKRMGIDPSDIEGGHITLNNGSAMYAQYGNPNLPAAYYYDASHEQVLSISGVTPK